MRAVAHGMKPRGGKGPSQAVAQDFEKADESGGTGFDARTAKPFEGKGCGYDARRVSTHGAYDGKKLKE